MQAAHHKPAAWLLQELLLEFRKASPSGTLPWIEGLKGEIASRQRVGYGHAFQGDILLPSALATLGNRLVNYG